MDMAEVTTDTKTLVEAAIQATEAALTGTLDACDITVALAADERTLKVARAALEAAGTTVVSAEVAAPAEALDVACALADEHACILALVPDGTTGAVRVAERAGGAWQVLSGDALAELVLHLIVSRGGTSLAGAVVGTTLASSGALQEMARSGQLSVWQTLPARGAAEALTGLAARQNERLLVALDGSRDLVAVSATALTNALAGSLLATCAANAAAREGKRLHDVAGEIGRACGFFDVSVLTHAFSDEGAAAMHLMGLRQDDADLICHMVVTDTHDYLAVLPMPGNPSSTLPFQDAVAWDLSDGSRIHCYAAGCEVTAIIVARGDDAAEARIVRTELEREAHTIITSGLPHA